MSCKGGNLTFPSSVPIKGNISACSAATNKDDCNTAASAVNIACPLVGGFGGKQACNAVSVCKSDGKRCIANSNNCHWVDSSNILMIILIIIGSLLASIIIGYVIMKFYKKRKTTAGGYYNY